MLMNYTGSHKFQNLAANIMSLYSVQSLSEGDWVIGAKTPKWKRQVICLDQKKKSPVEKA